MWWRTNTLGKSTTNHYGKTPGDNRLFQLRRINTYKADYNLLLKYFGPHRGTIREEKAGTMGNNQFGGQKITKIE